MVTVCFMPHSKETLRKFCSVCKFSYPRSTVVVVNQLCVSHVSERRSVIITLEEFVNSPHSILSLTTNLTLRVSLWLVQLKSKQIVSSQTYSMLVSSPLLLHILMSATVWIMVSIKLSLWVLKVWETFVSFKKRKLWANFSSRLPSTLACTSSV
jgi:hypothetical protein